MAAYTRNMVLIADDMVSNRIFLRNILKDDYDLVEASNGEVALQQIQHYRNRLVAVLLDLVMPGKDGIQTLYELKKMGCLDEFPVLVVTADRDVKNEAKILELGATDMIHKPYDPVVIKRRLSNFIELFAGRKKIENRADNLARAVNMSSMGVISMLATVTEFRSLESGQHNLRISSFAKILLNVVAELCPQYGLDQRNIDLIANAAILHDVGKVMIPDNILHKPGKLTPGEFEVMKSHTTAGAEIIKKMAGMLEDQFVRYAYKISRYHHERWDGRGYPDGLKRDNIPLCAQVVGICDVYDALTTPRVYKKAFSHEKAVEMILNGECGAFNPELLKCFQCVLEPFRKCAQEYADSEFMPSANDIHMPEPVSSAAILNAPTEWMSTAKYHALCRLVDGVILEVDMSTGVYELAYDTDGSFEALRAGKSFNETMLELLNTVVHPDDKTIATRHLLNFQRDFFESGVRRQTERFRVRSSAESEYFWVESNNLRVYTGNPNDRKAICVWKKVDMQPESIPHPFPTEGAYMRQLKKLPWVTLRCRQDCWMTVEEGMESLAELLGYHLPEMDGLCHGRLIELIVPEDRERVSSFLYKAREQGSRVGLEYRLRHKNGTTVWIMDRNKIVMEEDGREHVYRALLDNTEAHKELDETRLKLERQQLLLNNASEIFFEWDLVRDELYITDNFQDTFGYSIKNSHFSHEKAKHTRMVHKDDLPQLRKLLDSVNSSTSVAKQDIRIMKADGKYLWCRIRLVSQQWENGKTVSLLGTITNINADKLMVQNLKDQTQKDALTGLTSRAAASKWIEKYLRQNSEESKAAILVLDIDNFKRVNDTYGHAAGDSVLVTCAETIRHQFRSQDIVARLGGDEFLVFLRDIPSQHAAEKCCKKLVERFASDVSALVPDCQISCSVGIAVYPEDGKQFLQLQKNADKALLYAKQNGKNQYAVFSEIEEGEVIYRSTRTKIESNQDNHLSAQGFIAYTMHYLYRSGDLEETVNKVLGMVGNNINASRVYVFENSRDNQYCSNTFEWCSEGVPSVRDRQQKLSYETTLKAWSDQFKDSNIYYCRDTSALPKEIRELSESYGEKSFLHCAIRDNGEMCGFVGFSDCMVNRLWTQEQMSVLESFSELLSLFLLKKRAGDERDKWTENMLHILEKSQELVYLVEPNSYQLKFVNNELKKLLPGIKPGQYCYEKIMGRKSPCLNCPLQKIKAGEAASVETESDLLHKRMTIQGTKLFWDDEEVMLLACRESKE